MGSHEDGARSCHATQPPTSHGGHLFQGRYQGVLVERDAYLLELSRYVVLHPVRAGLVAEAGDWPWGSYGSMVGTASIPDWQETDWMLSRYGRDRPRAQDLTPFSPHSSAE